MRRLFITATALIVWSCALTIAVCANPPTIIRVAELSLRKTATKIVMPEFPVESIKQKASGVAVIKILLDENGAVVRTRVLEAPDSLTSKAVEVAVKQWTFQPQRVNGAPVAIQAKLTFYFVIDGAGVGRVVNPKQVN